jgi:hypothetical protein
MDYSISYDYSGKNSKSSVGTGPNKKRRPSGRLFLPKRRLKSKAIVDALAAAIIATICLRATMVESTIDPITLAIKPV